MARLAAFARWILAVLFTGIVIPVITDIIKKSPTTADAAAHPADTWSAIVNALLAFAHLPWVYPTAFVLGGLTVGAWLDWLLRKFDGSRAARRESLGHDFLSLADSVANRQGGFQSVWPQNIGDIAAEIMSAFVSAKKIGLWTPGSTFLERADGANLMLTYLAVIGRLLADRHFREAYAEALGMKVRLGL